ncbi:MAG: phenylalanine 4-monooxygenase [Deinococcales bacterium]|nr:phenylalanine 4-monooxygenase [Chitinophagaceae bacterium]
MTQDYNNYTENDQQVWYELYQRQIKQIHLYASKAYIQGMDSCGFTADKIPLITDVNNRLLAITGWQIEIVAGLIDNKSFFELLGQKRFPASTWLRKIESLDYLEEPDMFHDVLGHVPLLATKDFCGFLEKLANIALQYIDNDDIIEAISRLYWYTVEFGLIQEGDELKIYGAGILSSSGETYYSLHSDIPKRLPYNVVEILCIPYIKDKFQQQYFIIPSYKYLYDSLEELKDEIEKSHEVRKKIRESVGQEVRN